MILLCFLVFEYLLESIHLLYDSGRDWRDKYILNLKYAFKAIFMTLLIIDASYYYTHINTDRLRIARYFRPCNLL